jgi:hypothetical protein
MVVVVGSVAVIALQMSLGVAAAEESNPYASKASTEEVDRPPTCVKARPEEPGYYSQTIHVDNECTDDQRVKVIMAFGPDSECMVIAPNTTSTYKATRYHMPDTRFDGLARC